MARRPIEHIPNRFRGELEGNTARHGDPIPCTVRVEWSDGTESYHDAFTKQWTRTHVYVLFRTATKRMGSSETPTDLPNMWVRADQCKRR